MPDTAPPTPPSLVPTAFMDGLPRQPRVLVVDDQPMHVQVLYRALAPECQVFMATSGENAIKVCADKRPDLLLLDVEMPGMSGFELLERLKADSLTRDTPVIFVTAHTGSETESRCLDAGAVDYITKPVNPRVVRSRVRTHLLLKFQSDTLREMVFLDGLTGAYNRRYFDERLLSEWARAKRSGTPLSLVMLDVDDFKAYNDSYGHQAGDDTLRALVQALREPLHRPGDMLARYGGEEFACLLPETGFEQAMAVAQRLEQQVRQLGLEHRAASAASVVTVSLGVSTMGPPHAASPDDLLETADRMLYAAKKQGKARVVGEALAPSEDTPTEG